MSSLAYRPSNVSTAPTAYWKLNELSTGAGAVSRLDSSGNGHTLTDVNTCIARGGYIEGVGCDFDGSSYLTAADSNNWDFGTGDFSVSFWVKHDTQAAGRYFYSHGPAPMFGFRVVGGTDTIYLNGVGKFGTATQFINDTWQFVAITRVSAVLNLYIDGVLKDTGASTENVTGATTVFSIGAFNDGSNAHDGALSDFAIWKGYGLSASEVASLACGLPVQQSGIVSYWKLNEASGTRADSIGSNTLQDNNTVLSAAAKVGDGADFEGDNDEFLSITDAAQSGLKLSGADVVISVLMWAKHENSVSNYMWSKGGAFGDGYTGQISGNMVFYANTATDQAVISPALTTGIFYHYGWIFEAAADRVRFFLDSINKPALGGSLSTDPTDNTRPFYLGQNSDAGAPAGTDFDGVMDEVVFATRAFRPEEIKTIYNKGLNAKEVTSLEVAISTVKKVAGVSYASIKKISGVAIASVKKVAGVA